MLCLLSGVNDVYYDTVKPKIIRKSLRPTLKNSVNGKEGGNKGLQAAQEHSEYAMLDTSRMQVRNTISAF